MPSITSWNRLEPRARNGDMSPGLQARVHDPLWLLARQWQVGEFQGEDAGSPVWARLRAETAALTTVRAPGGQPAGYNPAVPLETTIECEPTDPGDCRTAAEAGLHFLRLLTDEGAADYCQPFRAAFPMVMPEGDIDTTSRRYLEIMAGRAPDGLKLADTLRHGLPDTPPCSRS